MFAQNILNIAFAKVSTFYFEKMGKASSNPNDLNGDLSGLKVKEPVVKEAQEVRFLDIESALVGALSVSNRASNKAPSSAAAKESNNACKAFVGDIMLCNINSIELGRHLEKKQMLEEDMLRDFAPMVGYIDFSKALESRARRLKFFSGGTDENKQMVVCDETMQSSVGVAESKAIRRVKP